MAREETSHDMTSEQTLSQFYIWKSSFRKWKRTWVWLIILRIINSFLSINGFAEWEDFLNYLHDPDCYTIYIRLTHLVMYRYFSEELVKEMQGKKPLFISSHRGGPSEHFPIVHDCSWRHRECHCISTGFNSIRRNVYKLVPPRKHFMSSIVSPARVPGLGIEKSSLLKSTITNDSIYTELNGYRKSDAVSCEPQDRRKALWGSSVYWTEKVYI